MAYDSTQDTLAHIRAVEILLKKFCEELKIRAFYHDDSKLQEPEKSMYDEFKPKLAVLQVGTPEYQEALAAMGDGLKHHYQSNSHHPEHFSDGINGMSLFDLVEMFCDWQAVSQARGQAIPLSVFRQRFDMSEQLARIIENTEQVYLANPTDTHPTL